MAIGESQGIPRGARDLQGSSDVHIPSVRFVTVLLGHCLHLLEQAACPVTEVKKRFITKTTQGNMKLSKKQKKQAQEASADEESSQSRKVCSLEHFTRSMCTFIRPLTLTRCRSPCD
eukprot:4687241-Pyramimonas_sp.AAC.1